MARTRYQEGSLKLRKGKKRSTWYGTWRIDVIEDGQVVRKQISEALGTVEDFPTRKLARRELDRRLAEINDPNYRARPITTFKEFAEQWLKTVLTQFKPSYQSSEKSRINRHLIPALGSVKMRDITGDLLQSWVSGMKLSPKTIKNVVTTLQTMWVQAKEWNHVGHDPFGGLKLKTSDDSDKPEEPCYSLDEARQIIGKAKSPYDVVFLTAFETGIRRGEICALNVGDVDLDRAILIVRRSRWGKHITSTKNRKKRVFLLSDELVARLRFFTEGRAVDEPLFLTPIIEKKGKTYGGKRLHPDNFVKRELKPIVKALGLDGAMHAFRHGNATWCDSENVPMAVRQARLGHADPKTTMGYTHKVNEDERRAVQKLGAALSSEMVQ